MRPIGQPSAQNTHVTTGTAQILGSVGPHADLQTHDEDLGVAMVPESIHQVTKGDPEESQLHDTSTTRESSEVGEHSSAGLTFKATHVIGTSLLVPVLILPLNENAARTVVHRETTEAASRGSSTNKTEAKKKRKDGDIAARKTKKSRNNEIDDIFGF